MQHQQLVLRQSTRETVGIVGTSGLANFKYLELFLVFLITVPVFLFPRAFLLLLMMFLNPVPSNGRISQVSTKVTNLRLFAFLSFMMLISGVTACEKRSASNDSGTDL